MRGFGYCAMTIQIVLGILYMGSNMLTVPQFQETYQYLEMAETLVIDEYTGILYPLLVRFCSKIPFIPFQIPIYSLQIVLGLVIAYQLIYVFTKRKAKSVFGSLWINTIPFLAQAHVTLLPHSLICSLLAVMLVFVIKAGRDKKPLALSELIVCMCSYLLITQLGRAYFCVATGMLVWIVLVQLYEKAHKLLLMGITLLISMGVVISTSAIYSATQTTGAYGHMQRSFSASFFKRVGMSTMTERFMIYMPEEIEQTFTGAQLEEFAKYPYKLDTEFGPTLERKYGKDTANDLYWKLGLLGFGNATKDNLKAIAEDMADYAVPAAMYFSWRNERLQGSTSWNYSQFLKQRPIFSAAYIKTSQYAWLVGVLLSFAAAVKRLFDTKKLYIRVWLPFGVYIVWYACYFAVQGTNIYDYKLALLPLVLNYMGALYWIFRKEEK